MVKRKKKIQASKKVEKIEEVDHYEPSDSDDGFTPQDKILLDKRKGTKAEESEEEVLGVYSSDDDEEEEEEDNADDFYGGGLGSDFDSDIEDKEKGEDPDDLVDSKAWGKSKRTYYNTDYVDKDFGGMAKDDEELAQMEEEEAASIQKRLMANLEQADITLGLLDQVEEKKVQMSKKEDILDESEKIVTDLSKMSRTEKIQLLKLESPELFQLIDEFKDKMCFAEEKLKPILGMVEKGSLKSCPASKFIETHYTVILNYCTNIVFYLMLRASQRGSLDHHPVINRLFSYKKLLDEMDESMEEKLLSQVESLLEMKDEELEPEEEVNVEPTGNRAERRKRKLMILKEAKTLEKMAERKKVKLEAKKGEAVPQEPIFSESSSEEDHPAEEQEEEDSGEEGKRAITYEMKKNKGLTPRRKKENRNPRVKNRNKYRKAKIRRKGQVRDVRTEERRYDGEIFGIKKYLTKSVKFKS